MKEKGNTLEECCPFSFDKSDIEANKNGVKI